MRFDGSSTSIFSSKPTFHHPVYLPTNRSRFGFDLMKTFPKEVKTLSLEEEKGLITAIRNIKWDFSGE